MPITTTEAGKAKLTATNSATRKEMNAAADEVDFSDLFRGSGTISEDGSVRIDNQGPWTAGEGRNIQAQVGNNSIAAVRVAGTLGAAATAAAQAAVVTAVAAALASSAATGNWYEVTGTSP